MESSRYGDCSVGEYCLKAEWALVLKTKPETSSKFSDFGPILFIIIIIIYYYHYVLWGNIVSEKQGRLSGLWFFYKNVKFIGATLHSSILQLWHFLKNMSKCPVGESTSCFNLSKYL